MAQEFGVRVMCRFRPLNESEVRRGSKHLRFTGSDTVVVSGKPYVFDTVFPPNTTQEQVYESCAKDTVRDVLGGYNGTIFTYGQTSSGKTHTMEGKLHDPKMMGIIPRIAHDIFDHIYLMQENLEFHIKVSYFEIYLEKIRDLLDVSKTNLAVHENKHRVPYVKGCTERFVSSPEEMMQVIDDGKANRHVAVTNMNEHSSRSHSIFLINIKQENLDTAHKLTGKLYLVDLAGSEKVSKTGASGTVLEEARMINKSLSALGNVISALAEGTKTHVPYRDSKMTRILQDSLGGNCRTTIIICCSPSFFNEAETRSTLLFGQRAKSIRNTVCVNLELTAEEWKKKYNKEKQKGVDMKTLLEELKSELQQWRIGVCVPVTEQLCDKKQETFSDHTLIASDGLVTDPLCFEGEKNINYLYKLLDDKDEEINLQTQLVEKLKLQMEVQKEFLSSSRTDCARVQEGLNSLSKDNQEMRGEMKEVLAALEELALGCSEKSRKASELLHTNLMLSDELAVKNEMLEASQTELAELHELCAVQKETTVDVLRVLLRDLGDMATVIGVHEINLQAEASMDDGFSVVRLFTSKLKSELQRLAKGCKQLESVNEYTSSRIQTGESELMSCHIIISQFQVKIKSLTECVQKAEESKRLLEVSQRTLVEELTKLQTYESNKDLHELEKQKGLLRINQSQQSQCDFSEDSKDSPSKSLREKYIDRQKLLNKLKELNSDLLLEQKRLECKNETLMTQQQEKEIKLRELIVSTEKPDVIKELKDFEEMLAQRLQNLHDLRRMFVQDLTTRVKKRNRVDDENGGRGVVHKHKISFLENNLEQLTKAHKQLVRENADLRCELPKFEKRLRVMTERTRVLEFTLREVKQSASRERRRYQQEVDRIKDSIRAKHTAWSGHSALIIKPIRAGHHHTFCVTAGGNAPTIYSYHHI